LNRLRAGYFKYVISVATSAHSIERSDSICPNSIYAAYFEQELLWFIYFFSVNPKVFLDWCRFSDVHIQSTWEKMLSRGPFEHFGILGQAAREMLRPGSLAVLADASFQN